MRSEIDILYKRIKRLEHEIAKLKEITKHLRPK